MSKYKVIVFERIIETDFMHISEAVKLKRKLKEKYDSEHRIILEKEDKN